MHKLYGHQEKSNCNNPYYEQLCQTQDTNKRDQEIQSRLCKGCAQDSFFVVRSCLTRTLFRLRESENLRLLEVNIYSMFIGIVSLISRSLNKYI